MINGFIYLFYAIGVMCGLCIALPYFVYIYGERCPRLKEFKIYTDGDVFSIKFRGTFIGSYFTFTEAKKEKNNFYIHMLDKWKLSHKKYVRLDTERSIKKYLKENPEKMDRII